MKPSPISAAMLVVSLLLAPALSAQSPDSANQGAASSAASTAEVPRLIKFSGTLLDAQDHPLTGPVGVTFALHAQQTGGTALWTETQNVTPDAHGNYTVLLGANSTNGVPAELFASGEARWLEVQVERQAEQARILLVSVPYALKAKDAETLGGRPASAFLTTETLAGNSTGAAAATAQPSAKAQAIPKKTSSAPQPAAVCPNVTSDGTATANSVAKFTAACNVQNSAITEVGGNVGIGTIAPIRALEVTGGSNASVYVHGAGTHQVQLTGATSGRLGQDAAGFFFSSDTNGSTVRFLTNNGTLNEWMRITSAGNVGIGTQAPTATLDVASAATAGNLFRVVGPTGGLMVQANATSPNILAGCNCNSVGTAHGATVSGGGFSPAEPNNATGNWATVSGGSGNNAAGSLDTVSGGQFNTASGGWATVSGGYNSRANGGNATVSGGYSNTASGGWATVSGGIANTASGKYGTVSGGEHNIAQGSGSFAAGQGAQALHDGTFVWGDNTLDALGTPVNFTSTAANQFLIRASGGVGIGTTTPTATLDVFGPPTNVVGQAAIFAQGGSSTATGGFAADGIDPVGGNASGPSGFAGFGVTAVGGNETAATGGVGGDGGDFFGGNASGTSGHGGFGVFGAGGNETAAGGVAGDGGGFTAGVASNGATKGLAAHFQGDIQVTGAITAGTKDFKIDHPLDPANKYLVHASVESSEMLNIYTGNATLDARGSTSVQLPAWFEVLNKDFRYQLTAVGAPGPNLYILQEIQGGRFVIAGGQPGMKVSWQVTGVRQDAFAKAHPLVVEEEKLLIERGHYIHPELYGAPEEAGVQWARHPQLMKRMKKTRPNQTQPAPLRN